METREVLIWSNWRPIFFNSTTLAGAFGQTRQNPPLAYFSGKDSFPIRAAVGNDPHLITPRSPAAPDKSDVGCPLVKESPPLGCVLISPLQSRQSPPSPPPCRLPLREDDYRYRSHQSRQHDRHIEWRRTYDDRSTSSLHHPYHYGHRHRALPLIAASASP